MDWAFKSEQVVYLSEKLNGSVDSLENTVDCGSFANFVPNSGLCLKRRSDRGSQTNIRLWWILDSLCWYVGIFSAIFGQVLFFKIHFNDILISIINLPFINFSQLFLDDQLKTVDPQSKHF